MKILVALLIVVLLVAAAWIAWEFQPWMAAGQAVHVSNTHVADYDFQVWQRKNPGRTEPFTTWLFARKQGGKWMPFMLDFEDTYRPSIALRQEASGIAVLRGRARLGLFDQSRQTYTRAPDGTIFQSAEIESEPPGNW